MQGTSCCPSRQYSFAVARSCPDNKARLQGGSQNHPVLLHLLLSKTIPDCLTENVEGAAGMTMVFQHQSPAFSQGVSPCLETSETTLHNGNTPPKCSICCWDTPLHRWWNPEQDSIPSVTQLHTTSMSTDLAHGYNKMSAPERDAAEYICSDSKASCKDQKIHVVGAHADWSSTSESCCDKCLFRSSSSPTPFPSFLSTQLLPSKAAVRF